MVIQLQFVLSRRRISPPKFYKISSVLIKIMLKIYGSVFVFVHTVQNTEMSINKNIAIVIKS